MQSAIRTKLPHHRAPPGLAARIGAALPREEPLKPFYRSHRSFHPGCHHSTISESVSATLGGRPRLRCRAGCGVSVGSRLTAAGELLSDFKTATSALSAASSTIGSNEGTGGAIFSAIEGAVLGLPPGSSLSCHFGLHR
jgi:hypothetical protein